MTAITGLAFVYGIAAARAQDASPWKAEFHAAARLIAGAARKSGGAVRLRAGVEIRLDPGWHTYWRSPGDSGVPPTFNFAGSENVKSVSVLWPAPKRFADHVGGHFNGYLADVVFPLRIIPKDATKPSSLHLKLTYAYCKEMCFPAAADLALNLSGTQSVEEQALLAAEKRVPRHVVLGDDSGFAIHSVHRERSNRKRVIVEIAAPDGAPVDLFVEGPTPDWSLPPPEPIDAVSTIRRLMFNLDGLPAGAHPHGARLTFTAASPDDSIEVVVPLD